ncbi:hypothetical protein [Nocardia arizonensis]|uniref:hypothetical protein n=1 Tax=Nocardia arizonensis TaxID=1141647 RepID=UPI000ACA65E1|nr:hypothetical protein [Nocardia arizonensis]
MAAELGGVSAWPEQWRWDDDLVDGYRARGMSGVVVEEIDCEGLRESGVLLPMRRPPRWQGVVFALMGFVFLALAGLLIVESALHREWPLLLLAALLVAIGAPAVVGAYRRLLVHRAVVPGLVLTPNRVIRRGGDGELLAVAWSDIEEIRPYARTAGSPRKWHNVFGIDVRDPRAFRRGGVARGSTASEIVTVSDAVVRMNPLLAYHLVRHYFQHPDQRPHIERAVAGTR